MCINLRHVTLIVVICGL
uniref:Uncharacterized protein n=1 Tax=Arundo donax TaxID=35708 RepID=A0A0A8Y9K2_ARUDO